MYSLSLDYIFNRVYDVLLWIKYVTIFVIGRKDPSAYLEENKNRVWDGLRDRGWFDEYLFKKSSDIANVDQRLTPWESFLNKIGIKSHDRDGDGIPDLSDKYPDDPNNLTDANIKEMYEKDYSTWDKIGDMFGVKPQDTDGDGVPNSYELKHYLDPKNRDTDNDGLIDGKELTLGTNPLNNDTDRDGIIDGRDEAPLDGNVSALSLDTDKDGLSDKIEKILGTDINNIDTDNDGIPDGMDTYPMDPNNISSVPQLDINNPISNLHFSIQNPILSFFSDMLSVIALFGIVFLMYSIIRWFNEFWGALNHYEHHFHHGDDHGGNGLSHDKSHKHGDDHDSMPAGIKGLPIMEENIAPALPPTQEDFVNHPRWAVIEGYLSSSNEALWRIGILEADNMLREVLSEKGYEGADVGEMLTSAKFNTIQLAWDAHKVRNRIAHEGSDYHLTDREAKRVFVLYEAVFKELKAIQ